MKRLTNKRGGVDFLVIAIIFGSTVFGAIQYDAGKWGPGGSENVTPSKEVIKLREDGRKVTMRRSYTPNDYSKRIIGSNQGYIN